MKKKEKMELNLCGSGHCPEVKEIGNKVVIGEKGNLVELEKEEWNALIEGIKSGRLHKI